MSLIPIGTTVEDLTNARKALTTPVSSSAVPISSSNLMSLSASNLTAVAGYTPNITSDNDVTSKICLTSPRTGRRVVFDALPTISESQNVNYTQLSSVHMPGSYQIFDNSPGRTFDISDIQIVSRNAIEARKNLFYLHTIRGWTKPYFGNAFAEAPISIRVWEPQSLGELNDYSGSPPEVLKFSTFSKIGGVRSDIPVVIGSYSFNYPNNIDYILTASDNDDDPFGGVPMPIILALSISLLESHSPEEFNSFNLVSYRNGILPGF